MSLENAYIISKVIVDGGIGIIKVEYFNPDEYKITIAKDSQIVDTFTVVGMNQALSKIMFYQNQLFSKPIESMDIAYDQLTTLKELSKK